MSTHQLRMEPVGGPILTRSVRILAILAALSVILLAWRFLAGLGATTALNDGYPWGLWIAFDVVVGTALATGGYSAAILVYLLNRGQYHPLIRSALATSALGYTLGGLGVIIDLGRFWNVPKVPLEFWNWNLHSILLEVALCIMLYTAVVWLELSPAFLEKWSKGSNLKLRKISTTVLPVLDRALPWLIALGVLLPTMHQSSLGGLMMLAGPKLHGLWQTPFLPLLFLISSIAMGCAAVVIESSLSSAVFKRPQETPILASLGGVLEKVLWFYIAIRVVDIAVRGRAGLIFAFDRHSTLFLFEMLLFVTPAVMLTSTRRRTDLSELFRAAMLIVLAGSLYRFSTFLIAFNPGDGWRYFPAAAEILITAGLVSAEIIAYLALVKRFPILSAARQEPNLPVSQVKDQRSTRPVLLREKQEKPA